MQESVIQSVVLPVAIAVIMVTLGMTLTIADFKRILPNPNRCSSACSVRWSYFHCLGLPWQACSG